jgi:hypothetical protein
MPRRNPYQLFRIQSDLAAGLTPVEIATKHGLPLTAVTRAVRRRANTGLPDPFHLRGKPATGAGAIQLYWLGYIAAAGRLFEQGATPALVLAVDNRDVDHVRVLIADLCSGHPSCEWCESSVDGLQAYIRDRDLSQMLAEWGTPGADPAEGSVPVELVPRPLLSHFVRGYLEGSRGVPPFGISTSPASLTAVRRVTMTGPAPFITALGTALRQHAGNTAGTIQTRRNGLALLTYRDRAARRIVEFAFRGATRTLARTETIARAVNARPGSRNGGARRSNGDARGRNGADGDGAGV